MDKRQVAYPWFERQRAFLDFTLASLWRRKARNMSLLLVYTLVVFMIASVMFFTNAIKKEALTVLDDAPEMVVQRLVGGRHDLIPVSYMEKVEEIPGALSVRPRLWGYYYHQASRANYTMMAPEEFAYGEEEIKVGKGVLRTWGTAHGNELYFKSHDGSPLILKVAETFGDSTDLVSADLILMAESTFRKIAGVPEGYATDLAVRIRNDREYQTIAEKIVLALPDTRPILKTEIIRTYTSLFDWRSGYIIVLLTGAFLAFFIFAWDKATGLSAEEKGEIGILKGLGWDTSDILMMKFWEGTAVSLSAFLFGVMAAYIHVFFASATLFEHALKGWAVLYPRFTPIPTLNFYELGVLFFLTVVPYAFITVIPAWKVSVMDPDTVMRH